MLKWAKRLRDFLKENIRMAKRHMERWSASPIIWEMQIKTTIKYHIISVRTILLKKKKTSVGKDVEKLKHWYTVDGNSK